MTVTLFGGRESQRAEWAPHLRRWSEELGVPIDLRLSEAEVDPAEVEVVIVNPFGDVTDYSPYGHVKLLQSMWAGVEVFLADDRAPMGPPLARMVEPGMTEGMTEYITGHVMRHHIGVDRFIADTAARRWAPWVPPLARDRKIGVLGLGQLGGDAAAMLAGMRFDVAGWSRSPKEIEGVDCRHGAEGLREVIARSEIIVTILPLTDETRHVLNAETLSLAPEGAVVINPGRGPLIDDDALLDALDAGRIGHATLDVFAVEPLPEDHPYWAHPRVTVTPHIASETRPEGAARHVIEQIGRVQRGEAPLHVVDRAAGY